MPELQLQQLPSLYHGIEREKGDVLVGDDVAAPLIDAASKHDEAGLRAMLEQKRWTKVALERPHRIYSTHSNNGVLARPIPNFETMLDGAIIAGAIPTVQYLLDWGTRNGFPLSSTINRETVSLCFRRNNAMFVALAELDPRAARMHLYHGADVMSRAVDANDLKSLELLFKHGATVAASNQTRRLRPNERGLLWNATVHASPAVIELLVQRGASIRGSGALHTAVSRGFMDKAETLLRLGADVNELVIRQLLTYERGLKGGPTWTPLHAAMAFSNKEATQWLFDNGADENIQGDDGKTAYDIAGCVSHDGHGGRPSIVTDSS
ncbi:hypothetical protein FH972_021048 [Carpinus fangiana]|uniref:Uncharacterized protein n=1 Tax=Carpinus fangiana TaxID=176857 RepID=A0A5N6KNS6_9ROSI|nr:hypothetical protein FH972_021048 [Carpinus fangiana]